MLLRLIYIYSNLDQHRLTWASVDNGDGRNVLAMDVTLTIDEMLLVVWWKRMGLMVEDDDLVFRSSSRERDEADGDEDGGSFWGSGFFW